MKCVRSAVRSRALVSSVAVEAVYSPSRQGNGAQPPVAGIAVSGWTGTPAEMDCTASLGMEDFGGRPFLHRAVVFCTCDGCTLHQASGTD